MKVSMATLRATTARPYHMDRLESVEIFLPPNILTIISRRDGDEEATIIQSKLHVLSKLQVLLKQNAYN